MDFFAVCRRCFQNEPVVTSTNIQRAKKKKKQKKPKKQKTKKTKKKVKKSTYFVAHDRTERNN